MLSSPTFQVPLVSLSLWMLFLLHLWFDAWWKNLVFLSRALIHSVWALCLRIFSSLHNNLPTSNFKAWTGEKSCRWIVVTSTSFNMADFSLSLRVTWLKQFLLHCLSWVRHLRIFSWTCYIGVPDVWESQARLMASAQPGSPTHMLSKHKGRFQKAAGEGGSSWSQSGQWSHLAAERWWTGVGERVWDSLMLPVLDQDDSTW